MWFLEIDIELIQILLPEDGTVFSLVEFVIFSGNEKWGLLLQTALTPKQLKLGRSARSTFVEKLKTYNFYFSYSNFDHPKPR